MSSLSELVSQKSAGQLTLDAIRTSSCENHDGHDVSSLSVSPQKSSPSKHESHCLMPHDSEILKEGELLKIGRKTGTMRKRYYVMRDHSLFIYNNKGQKVPSSLIFLKGMFIN